MQVIGKVKLTINNRRTSLNELPRRKHRGYCD